MLRVGCVVAWLVGMPGVAHAQEEPGVAAGVALYGNADFEGAIARLEMALADDTLSREGVAFALDRIAAAALALGRQDDLDRALRRLMLVNPNYTFGQDVPAELGDRLEAVRPEVTPVTVRVFAVDADGGATEVRAEVRGDSTRSVRTVDLSCDVHGRSETASARSPRLILDADADCTAIARGPGGLPLARGAWSSDGEVEPAAGGAGTVDGGGGGVPWLAIGIAGGVAIAVIAVIAVIALASGDEQPADGELRLVQPTVTW